jgi:hypothetical protein
VTIRLSAAEWNAIQRQAAEAGQAVAAWVGQAAVDAATGAAMPASRAQLEQLRVFKEACRLLRKRARALADADHPGQESRDDAAALMGVAEQLEDLALRAWRAWSP